jgi:uncharacterized ferredoxin-like protein
MGFSSAGAQIAAYESWAKTSNRAARTAPARKAMMERFEKLVDPDGVFPADVREKMADSAKKAHYRRMALKSARVRARG